ncbi:transposase [Methylomonas sp. EbA]|uniref:Transposase n=1 Tax=Methylomonas albis TaxID=1854563 RepID=A0ABR9D6B8_9GAMM|nr:transposase [Methylomonas albis]
MAVFNRNGWLIFVGILSVKFTWAFLAIEVTSNRVTDAQVLPDLLNQIPRDNRIDSVSAHRAYDAKQSKSAIAERDAETIIPVLKDSKPLKENTLGAITRNETLRTTDRLGRGICRKWSGYHRRSLVKPKCVVSNF